MSKNELKQLEALIIKYNAVYSKPYPTLGAVQFLLIVNDQDDKRFGKPLIQQQ